MTITAKKKELIKWISSIENPDIINQIFEFKKMKSRSFDYEIENAITSQELREETDAYIKSLNWEK